MSTTTKAPAKKPAQKSEGFKGIKNAFVVILICVIIAIIIFYTVFGNGSHFQGGDNANDPIDLVGTIFKGGVVVPVIHGMFYAVIAFVVERWLALRTAFGKGSLEKFTEAVRKAMAANDIAAALKVCDAQQGSVANVVRAALERYQVEEADATKTKAQKLEAIKAALDDATALEMPTLQMNLPILGVLTSLGVLTGLFGTVLGMIKSFQSISGEGGGDSSALSTGISEALVNTASGIATSALALVFYNFYTNRIDRFTYSLEEVGFIIVQNYALTH
ncbi:MAG: MotA/TolQ/ExbB proton channel family protein [Bacteroidaceae bacterium]|nr:MotA/TolQ/ExbB proton channel family protein [Prevotellaceae bacterium]MDY2850026.1 MotA/TolQ/ExbB proton channel family protein [Bacteroidaceae bacterium]